MKLQILPRTFNYKDGTKITLKDFDEYQILTQGGFNNIKFMFNKLRIYNK